MKSGSCSLEGVLAKFSGRIAKLPAEFQAIFFGFWCVLRVIDRFLLGGAHRVIISVLEKRGVNYRVTGNFILLVQVRAYRF